MKSIPIDVSMVGVVVSSRLLTVMDTTGNYNKSFGITLIHHGSVFNTYQQPCCRASTFNTF